MSVGQYATIQRGLLLAGLALFSPAVALAQPDSAAPRLILISIDGLRPDAITPESAPRLTALGNAGVSAANAINDLPSATLPNHATMLSGLVSDRHGLILNNDLPGVFPYPTLMNHSARAGLRVGFFVSKSKLLHLADPAALATSEYAAETGLLVERLIEQLSELDVVILHLRDPDSTGHRSGWMTPDYVAAVATSDAHIGRLLDALGPEAQTIIMVTADHGGDGTNHFLNIDANRRIPWIVAGTSIPAGCVISAPVTTADTTPTALALLGIAVPAGLDGGVVPFDENASNNGPTPVAPVGLPCVLLLAPLILVSGVVATRRPIG